MKAKLAIALLALVTTGLVSCEKNLYDPNRGEEDDTLVTDLVISGDFDWKMIENGTCNITSARAVRVNIYSDKTLDKKSLLATTAVKAGGTVSLPLSLPTGISDVYVQYEGATGAKEVAAAPVDADGTINFSVPGTMTRALSDDDFLQTQPTVLLYPNGGFGTVMFEDNYPVLGDYDFNDFVANYQIKVETEPGFSNRINKITLYMQARAIGADQKINYYIPHLGFSIPESFLESVTVSTFGSFNNDPDKVAVENVTGKTVKRNYMVFAFNGAEKNSQKASGSIFLNTDQEFVTTDMKTFEVVVTFKKTPVNGQYADLEYIKADGFDIFLATPDRKREIHMLGQYHVFAQNQSEYKNEDNFVWGINIPSATIQATERANFLKAYPKFKEWVTGQKGPSSAPWYQQGVKEYLFNYGQ